MTVLFADVVRSMDLAAQLDSERLREVMSELFNRCGVIVGRYGGTVDKFTGDGIMAIFGAPIALEDHAARACMAALEIQREVARLATDLRRRDGVQYSLRVGLNSGDVVTGQIGVDPTSYTAVGAQVGMAQRMESVAPAGGVMVSVSTARLVEHTAVLGEPQLVAIKGSDSPVPARQLHAMGPRKWPLRHESALIGRDSEMRSLTALLNAIGDGHGHVVTVSGPPGIGKSRICRELVDLADSRGFTTYSTFCESHARDMSFRVIARLLRDVFDVADLDDVAARGRLRGRLGSADPEDVALLDELLGVGDPAAAVHVPADARRRRLTRLVASELAAHHGPAVLLVEDVHWIDDASEAMLAEVLEVVSETSVIAMLTYRPEYRGALRAPAGASHLVLAPLADSDATTLTAELMGSDPSLGALTEQIIGRAAGNPFFVHEIVRDLAERKVIDGSAGAYVRRGDFTDVTVPPTLQAAIASRIDRLTSAAKSLLNAAAVIGSQFPADLLANVIDRENDSIQPALAELVRAELIYPVVTVASTEYGFRHPLIRTVAEASQLKTGRSTLHRRLADAIERRSRSRGDEHAPLIASHLEAAGDLREAFGWYMRAGAWLANRDIGAARANWHHARRIADLMPADEPDRNTMRIAPRSLLCGSTWRAGGSVADTGFDDLRRLCTEATSQIPLLMGMAGLISTLSLHGLIHEATHLTPEYVARIDAVGDRTLTVALLFAAIYADRLAGKWHTTRELSQRVIDLAGGDATFGNVLTGSPLAFATAMRANARCCLGESGWLADFDAANTIAYGADPTTFVSTVMFKYVTGMALGALVPNAAALAETAEALEIAHRYSEDLALGLAQLARGMTLIRGGEPAQRTEGFALLASARDLAVHDRFAKTELAIIDVETAAERARLGDVDAAIASTTGVLDDCDRSGAVLYRGAATSVLVTSLLQRQAEGDLARAHAAVDRLAAAPSDDGSVMDELPLLRLRALLAKTQGDTDSYRGLIGRYRSRADALDFQAHIAYASAMT